MEKTKFTGAELKAKGFSLTQDGGTVYYQFILDKTDPLNSSFLSSDDLEKTNSEVGVKFNDTGDYLKEETIDSLTK